MPATVLSLGRTRGHELPSMKPGCHKERRLYAQNHHDD